MADFSYIIINIMKIMNSDMVSLQETKSDETDEIM